MAAAWAAFPRPWGPKPLRSLRAVVRANTVHPSLHPPSQRQDHPGQGVPKSHPSTLMVHIWPWFVLRLWLEEQSILCYIHGEASRKPGLSSSLDNRSGLMQRERCCSHSRVSPVCCFSFFFHGNKTLFFSLQLRETSHSCCSHLGKATPSNSCPGKLPHSSWTGAPQDALPFTGAPRAPHHLVRAMWCRALLSSPGGM